MAKMITAVEAAAALINHNATIAISGFVGCANPEALTAALEERFISTGTPRSLTLVYCSG